MRELHAHITGSIPARDILTLIKENDLIRYPEIKSFVDSMVDFERFYPCWPNGTNRFHEVMSRFKLIHLIIEKAPFLVPTMGEMAAYAMFEQGVNYVEWRIDPFSGTDGTAEQAENKIREFYKGLKRNKFVAHKFVIGIGKHRYTNKNLIASLRTEMINFLNATKDLPIVALDAVNAEVVSIADLSPVLSLAHAYGLGLVPHVGECTSDTLEENLQTIEDALVLKPNRLGHAIVAYMDLPDYLKERQLDILYKIKASGACVEVCPTSNLSAHLGLKYYDEHPIMKLVELDIPFIVCTDDFAIFGRTLMEEIDGLVLAHGLNRQEIIRNIERFAFV